MEMRVKKKIISNFGANTCVLAAVLLNAATLFRLITILRQPVTFVRIRKLSTKELLP